MKSLKLVRSVILYLIFFTPALAVGQELEFQTIIGAGDVPLNVGTTGPEEAQSILFIHGIGQSYLSFDRQLDSPLAEQYRLVVFDLRGHGNSGKPWQTEAYNRTDVWAEDVASVIEAMGLEKPIVVAWSYGTLVTADYVRHNGVDALGGIVLTGAYGGLTPPPTAPMDDAIVKAMADNRSRQLSHNLNENIAAAELTSRILTNKAMSDEWRQRAVRIGLMLPPYARKAMINRSFDNQDVAARFALPVWLAIGEKDLGTPLDLGQQLVETLPDASVTQFKGAGHSPFVENPEQFNLELAAFVDRATAKAD